MERDSRMGPGHWRGCHSFKNITCDGEARNLGQSRHGGLKMGGKYWYYVRMRIDLDPLAHNRLDDSFMKGVTAYRF